jgi:hypothetical protein
MQSTMKTKHQNFSIFHLETKSEANKKNEFYIEKIILIINKVVEKNIDWNRSNQITFVVLS